MAPGRREYLTADDERCNRDAFNALKLVAQSEERMLGMEGKKILTLKYKIILPLYILAKIYFK